MGPTGILYEQFLLKCPGWPCPPVPLGTAPKLSALGYNLTLQPEWGCHPQSLMVILTSPRTSDASSRASPILEHMCSRADPGTARHLHMPGRHRHAQSHVFISLGVGSEAATLDFSFPCYSTRAEHRPPCGHGLVLSLCLCLLRHSSAACHHYHVWSAGAAPASTAAAKSPERSLCDSQSEECTHRSLKGW